MFDDRLAAGACRFFEDDQEGVRRMYFVHLAAINPVSGSLTAQNTSCQ